MFKDILVGKYLNSFIWMTIDKLIRMPIVLYVSILIARNLGPYQYGNLVWISSLFIIILAVSSLGLQNIVITEVLQRPKLRHKFLAACFQLQLISAVTCYLFVVTLALLGDYDEIIQQSIVIYFIVLIFKSIDFIIYWYEADSQIYRNVIIQLLATLVAANFYFILMERNASLIDFIYVIIFENFLIFSLYIFSARKWLLTIKLNNVNLKINGYLISKSMPLMLSIIAIAIYTRLDSLFIAYYLGAVSAGIYSASQRLVEIFYFPSVVIVTAFYPLASKYFRIKYNKYYDYTQVLLTLLIYIGLFVTLLLTFFSGDLVIFLYGTDFIYSSNILLISCWTLSFVYLGLIGTRWYVDHNLNYYAFERILYGLIINVFLNYLLIPNFGLKGAAVSSLIMHTFIGLIYDCFRISTRPLFIMKINALNLFKSYFIIRTLISEKHKNI
jgi:PST family polysaccharide transporter